jgi:hypothetical protein
LKSREVEVLEKEIGHIITEKVEEREAKAKSSIM